VIATYPETSNVSISRLEVPDLNFYIGDDAFKNAAKYNLQNPVKEG
jgi:hypothetical protein